MGSIAKLISNIGQKALIASNTLRIANTDTKNNALLNIAAAIQENKQTILDANSLDIEIAKKNNIDSALLDRLMLNDDRLESVVEGSQSNRLIERSYWRGF